MDNVIDFQKKSDEKTFMRLYDQLRPDIHKIFTVIEMGRMAGLSNDELWDTATASWKGKQVNLKVIQLVEGILHITIYGKEPPSK